ncbi:MAG: hypothetical protein MJ179_01190 [Treponema sp.]|nr:hypothetical protein [Treponema sp.]
MNKNDLMKSLKKKVFVNGKIKNKLVELILIERIDTTRDLTIYEANGLWEDWNEYDEQGNYTLTRKIYSNGIEKTITYENTYSNNGNLIHWKNSEGCEQSFDENGYLIYDKGYGNQEYRFDNSNKEIICTDYDKKGNEIHWKRADGFETWCEYDEFNNLIHEYNNEGEETWFDYDEKGNEIHWKRADKLESWYEYDEFRNLIHEYDNEGEECWYEYEFDGNIKTVYTYHHVSIKDKIYYLYQNIFNKLKAVGK